MNKEINLKTYFKRVGFTGSASPHLEVLKSLHLLHPQNIPFENLNPFTGQPVLLDTESLQQKLIFGSRGGYCFEQNLLFMHVLKAVGFRVKGLAARIMWNAPEGTINSRGHMLLLVEIEGRRYIADVGFGGLGPTAPILLEPGKEQETPHETYRIDAENEEYTLKSLVQGKWKPLYRFNLDEHYRADYEVTNWYLSNHPESHFVTDLIAARAESNPRCRYTLRNNEFTVHDFNSGTKKSRLNTVEEIRETLENVFGIRLPEGKKLNERLKEVIEKRRG